MLGCNGGKPISAKDKVTFLAVIMGVLTSSSIVAASTSVTDKSELSSKILRVMSRAYMAYGEYDRAQPLAEMALERAVTKGVCNPELGMCQIDLGTLYTHQGNLDDAEMLITEGMRTKEKFLTEDHPHIAYMLKILSTVYYKQHRYSKAISTLNRAVDIMLENHNPDDHAMAPFYEKIAKNLAAQGRLEDSQEYYQRAMLLVNKSYGPNHLYTTIVLAGMAKLYTVQGKYAEAEELIDRATATAEKIYGLDNYRLAPHWITKAEIYYIQGDYVRAEKMVNKALIKIELSGNTARYARLVQTAKEILADRSVCAHIANADKSLQSH